jgi:hypothetical protein
VAARGFVSPEWFSLRGSLSVPGSLKGKVRCTQALHEEGGSKDSGQPSRPFTRAAGVRPVGIAVRMSGSVGGFASGHCVDAPGGFLPPGEARRRRIPFALLAGFCCCCCCCCCCCAVSGRRATDRPLRGTSTKWVRIAQNKVAPGHTAHARPRTVEASVARACTAKIAATFGAKLTSRGRTAVVVCASTRRDRCCGRIRRSRLASENLQQRSDFAHAAPHAAGRGPCRPLQPHATYFPWLTVSRLWTGPWGLCRKERRTRRPVTR